MSGPQKYRKKPVVIEAVQWTGDNFADLRAFTGERRFRMVNNLRPDAPFSAQVYDELHSTWVGVAKGQWVIRGVNGEFYPIAPDVLAATYEAVSE